MRIPFFSKQIKVDVEVKDSPKVTRTGLKEGTPITANSFKTVESAFNKYYIDRKAVNQKMYDSKMEKSNEWVAFVMEAIKDIPKSNISEVRVEPEYKMDLESIRAPRLYLMLDYIRNNKRNSKAYEIFANEHDESERSINEILKDIKEFKKELAKDAQ